MKNKTLDIIGVEVDRYKDGEIIYNTNDVLDLASQAIWGDFKIYINEESVIIRPNWWGGFE